MFFAYFYYLKGFKRVVIPFKPPFHQLNQVLISIAVVHVFICVILQNLFIKVFGYFDCMFL